MFSARAGFFCGFIIGAVIWTLLSKTGQAEAPAVNGEQAAAQADAGHDAARSVIDRLRAHAQTALLAAQAAAAAKEREMRLQFEAATRSKK